MDRAEASYTIIYMATTVWLLAYHPAVNTIRLRKRISRNGNSHSKKYS